MICHLGSSQSCCLVKSMNVLEKEKKDRVPLLCQSQDQRKGRKHSAVNRQQTSLRATKVFSSTKANSYKKSQNMSANRIRVKSSRLK